MEVSVERTDSQKSQNNGPRVSFNKDVHVKRIGSRPNEIPNYNPSVTATASIPSSSLSAGTASVQQPIVQLRRELPKDLSEEGILKEAALVLAQAERVRCTAEGGSDIIGGRVNEKSRGRIERKKEVDGKFHSLPTRRKHTTKPVSRSVSDASTKKLKKPSIFSIFGRKSDTNLDQIDPVKESKENSNSKSKVSRSKSDVGSSSATTNSSNSSNSIVNNDNGRKPVIRKRNNSENDENGNLRKKAQLSPIIENPPKEDYFVDNKENIKSINNKDTQATTTDIKRKSSSPLTKQKSKSPSLQTVTSPPPPPPPPPGSAPQPKPRKYLNTQDTLTTTSGNIGYTNQEDLDLIPSKPISDSVRETIHSISKHSKSLEDMHCSQLPVQRPPLTKGVTVDGIVKRLSMERFSPPPHFNSPAFSYTRPNDNPQQQQIIYAQVVCDGDGKMKQTVHAKHLPKDTDKFSSRNGQHYHHHHNRYQDDDEDIGIDTIDSTINEKSSHNKNEYQQRKSNDRSASPHQQQFNDYNNNNNKQKTTNILLKNNSDEDEGLGLETKRSSGYDDDFIPTRDRKYSPNYNENSDSFEEPPIIPIIRDVSPVRIKLDSSYRGCADGMDARRTEFNELRNRREILESRIHSRRFGSRDIMEDLTPPPDDREHYNFEKSKNIINNSNSHKYSPEYDRQNRSNSRDDHHAYQQQQYNQKSQQQKYHQIGSQEILNKYSPERTHLDIISPTSHDVSTKYVQETKYYDDGNGGGYKETYNRETRIGNDGVPKVKETRYRERLDSPKRTNKHQPREIDLGYIEDSRFIPQHHFEPDTSYFQEKYRQEFEPKSLEYNDVNRSSPELHKFSYNNQGFNKNKTFVPTPERLIKQKSADHFDSLKREKKFQRSFDKGDSGIENDYRKDSFNGEFVSRWKRRTVDDNIKETDLFIKRERQHTEEVHPLKRTLDYIYRERSIDDGSHFDPRLDKYPIDSTLKRRNDKNLRKAEVVNKSEKKIKGLEKVKQLFTGGSKKKTLEKKEKDKYMIREDEMRLRYREHKGSSPDLREPKISDIATRRRLSTPKASPLPKRTASQQSSKSSSLSAQNETPQKMGWFKSLERLSRKKQQNAKIDSTTTEDEFSTLRPSKQRELSSAPTVQIPKKQIPQRVYQLQQQQQQQQQGKNLRFFGDTDLESNASLSKGTGIILTQRNRKPLPKSSLTKQQNYSQSAYDLDAIPKGRKSDPPTTTDKYQRSSSLQHLENNQHDGHQYNDRHTSRSRHNLNNISESASDNDIDESTTIVKNRHNSPIISNNTKSKLRSRHSSEHLVSSTPSFKYKNNSNIDDITHSGKQQRSSFENVENEIPFNRERSGRSTERSTTTTITTTTTHTNENRLPLKENYEQFRDEIRKPPMGPQKPARSMERRRNVSSRERDRIHDSSGTEGDSSQQSQRSVVYLHATTVGAIPQPYILNSRKTVSREELSSISKSRTGSSQLQPMTRSISRSVSVLAPWKPKHLNEGYEINYSQQSMEKPKKHSVSSSRKSSGSVTPTKPKKDNKSSTLTRTRKQQMIMPGGRDDLSSIRNSSITSASTMPRPIRKDNDMRKDNTLIKQRMHSTSRLENVTSTPINSGGGGSGGVGVSTGRRRWNE